MFHSQTKSIVTTPNFSNKNTVGKAKFAGESSFILIIMLLSAAEHSVYGVFRSAPGFAVDCSFGDLSL